MLLFVEKRGKKEGNKNAVSSAGRSFSLCFFFQCLSYLSIFFFLSQFRKNSQLFKSLFLRERKGFFYRSRTGN